MMGSEDCMWGMAGMGLIAILLIIALGLGIAALVKFLFFRKEDEKNRKALANEHSR